MSDKYMYNALQTGFVLLAFGIGEPPMYFGLFPIT
jgi:hypothetical protein